MAKIEGTFTGTTRSAILSTKGTRDDFKAMSLSLSGTWVGTVDVERSYDGGSTWHTIESHTANVEKNEETFTDYFVYSLNCSAYTSGTVTYFLAN